MLKIAADVPLRLRSILRPNFIPLSCSLWIHNDVKRAACLEEKPDVHVAPDHWQPTGGVRAAKSAVGVVTQRSSTLQLGEVMG